MDKSVDSARGGSKRPNDGGLLADRALKHIRGLIGAGRLGPGDRVNELEVAATLGISRGPVREAIRRLAPSGLLVPERHLGSRVVQLDREAVKQLYDVREALEALAAQLAARHMSDDERHRLVAVLDAHEAQMEATGADSYPRGEGDRDFHLLVIEGARNAVIWRICGEELRDLVSLLRGQHGSSAGRGRRALQEHRWIADAVVAGNADLAGMLMAQHIRASRDNLLSTMQGRRASAA